MFEIIKKIWTENKNKKQQKKRLDNIVDRANELLEVKYTDRQISDEEWSLNNISKKLEFAQRAFDNIRKYIGEFKYEDYLKYKNDIEELDNKLEFLKLKVEYMKKNKDNLTEEVKDQIKKGLDKNKKTVVGVRG